MKTGSLVSILIPVYCAEKYIERCAISLFEQTYENLEFIFVDDCTPDNSIQLLKGVLEKYPQRMSQVKIIYHNQNRGISATRNTLVDNCSGEFLFFVDSDDWIERDAIALMISQQKDTDADIVTSRVYDHWDDKVIEYIDGGWNANREEALQGFLEWRLSHSLWRRLIRTSICHENNIRCLEGVNMDEDIQFVVPLFYYSRVVAGLDAFVYHYTRDNKKSYARSLPKNYSLWEQRLKSIDMLISFFESKNCKYYQMASRLWMNRSHEAMVNAANNHDRKQYAVFAKHIYSKPQYWPEVKWDKFYRRVIERHYYLYVSFLPLWRSICVIRNMVNPKKVRNDGENQ